MSNTSSAGWRTFPEEASAVFDWMDRRRREPYPKKFEVVAARDTDQRFFGFVAQDFQPGRTTAPEAVEPMGKNLRPASIKMTSSKASNLLKFTTKGLAAS